MLKAAASTALVAIVVVMPVAALGSSADEVPLADDPLAPLNRKVLAINYVLDRALLRPASVVYRHVVPRFARTGVRNALDNLIEPRTVLNQCLQGKFGAASADAGRSSSTSPQSFRCGTCHTAHALPPHPRAPHQLWWPA